MSSYNINVKELMGRHFPFKLGFATQTVAETLFNRFDDIQVLPTHNESAKISVMGTPVWDFIDLKPSYVEGTREQFTGYSFPLETTIEPIRPKKIVETDIFGRDGNIEELIALDDWQLTIRGLIINYDSTDYPEQQVKELQRVCELKTSLLECEGTLLTMLGINYMSIHKLVLTPSIGYSHIQAFEIEAKSKIPFIISP
ncbi:hypothetical protein DRF65_00405 [Chryseobacterium pennae]|uniref:DUF6046 domain-containing protein n=1 Tax=Chryseobacterium pennae TaxID=2258962 RepID=A0A3D9CEX8_9FLAO|nr:DUF6046 domain-containing protein [Chryseobacterium pennae]REC64071.1 hypothetical protein DRF65_00405 [Chryseobacterium pennae]